MGDSKEQRDDTAETTDSGSFGQMLSDMTDLKEDANALDVLMDIKRGTDTKVQEQVARVKSQALRVAQKAAAVLDRLSLLDGIDNRVLARLEALDAPADCNVPPSRFTSGTQRVVTLMPQKPSKLMPPGDITRSIRHVWIFKSGEPSRYSSIYSVESAAFMVWGYMAKIEVTLSRVALGVYLVLQPGPNDDALSWPFQKVFTLTLVHPTDGSRDVHYRCVPYDTRSEHGPFDKPDKEPNDGCGTPSLCTIQFMKENGFIVNDVFCISVEILK